MFTHHRGRENWLIPLLYDPTRCFATKSHTCANNHQHTHNPVPAAQPWNQSVRGNTMAVLDPREKKGLKSSQETISLCLPYTAHCKTLTAAFDHRMPFTGTDNERLSATMEKITSTIIVEKGKIHSF